MSGLFLGLVRVQYVKPPGSVYRLIRWVYERHPGVSSRLEQLPHRLLGVPKGGLVGNRGHRVVNLPKLHALITIGGSPHITEPLRMRCADKCRNVDLGIDNDILRLAGPSQQIGLFPNLQMIQQSQHQNEEKPGQVKMTNICLHKLDGAQLILGRNTIRATINGRDEQPVPGRDSCEDTWAGPQIDGRSPGFNVQNLKYSSKGTRPVSALLFRLPPQR